MNTRKVNICQVCGEELRNGVCPKCGYIRIVFPGTVPESIKSQEAARVSATGRTLRELEQSKSDGKEAERRITDLEKKITDLEKELTQSTERSRQLGAERDNIEAEVERLRSNDKTSKKAHERALADLKRENEDLRTESQRKLNRASAELNALREELAETRQRLEQAKARPSKRLAGIVMVEDTRYNSRIMLPVYDGVNTYGSRQSADNHQRLDLHTRVQIQPVHFSLYLDGNRMIICPVNGANLSRGGTKLITNEVYAGQNDEFYIDNQLKINITTLI